MNPNLYDLIIVAQNPGLPTHQRFLFEAKRMGLKAMVLAVNNWPLTIFPLSMTTPKISKKKKWVVHRTMGTNFDEFDLRVSQYLSSHNFQICNSLPLLLQMRDKVSQLQQLASWGHPTIPSFIMRGNLKNENVKSLQQFLHYVKSSKFILKTERGNQGLGVSLINGEDSLYSWLNTLHSIQDQRFILQPYVEKAREFRILMVGEKCLGLVEKTAHSHNHNFKNNASNSQFMFIKKVKKDHLWMFETAKLIQTQLKSHFIAIDFLVGPHKNYLLEIGPCPGFIEFEKATSINVAQQLLKELFD